MGHRIEVDELLRTHGTTYAAEARITLRDEPSPLFQLLVLAQGVSDGARPSRAGR